jgi:hypothetical protein
MGALPQTSTATNGQMDDFFSTLLQLYILPIHDPAEIEFYSFLFLFPNELNEVDLTCRPMTARSPKERRTEGWRENVRRDRQ